MPVNIFSAGEAGCRAFGPPDDGARKVKPTGRFGSPGQDEGCERHQRVVQGVDLLLQTGDLIGLDAEISGCQINTRRREIGAKIEQIVLNTCQNFGERGLILL